MTRRFQFSVKTVLRLLVLTCLVLATVVGTEREWLSYADWGDVAGADAP